MKESGRGGQHFNGALGGHAFESRGPVADEHLDDVAPLECIGCPVEKDEGHGQLVDDQRQDQPGSARRDLKKSRLGWIRRTNRANPYRLAPNDRLRHLHG